MKRPIIVAVGGFTSEVGKTALVCDLLRAFPGWEAVKTTRGHYRSCGKDPHACCVSHLLRDEPLVYSGRHETYAAGKDTGRYWDAGAANVHWMIATDAKVEDGIKLALERVKARGVFIEGNSFTQFVKPDFMIMVARVGARQIKASARRALARTSVLYLTDLAVGDDTDREQIDFWFRQFGGQSLEELMKGLTVGSRSGFPRLVEQLQELQSALVA